jgi:multiple sugar transport system ATP-binding protein
MADLELRSMTKTYGKGIKAVDDLSLHIRDGEFIILVGPSGCGKSTILRMIAGLEEISQGEFLMDGALMNSVEPQRREIAMVFQSYALYPHLSVYENMAFPLRLRKMPGRAIDERVKDVARVLDLSLLLERMPRELSGGQRQRVALGRAMVREPKVFLFDEPLSNLDAKLRVEMRVEIAELHNRLRSNFVYVTHDQIEAMTLGQKIVVLKEGRLQQFASPQELFENPANTFVAGFIGTPPMNFLTVEIRREGDDYRLEAENFEITLPREHTNALEKYKKKKAIMGIRPGDLYLKESQDALIMDLVPSSNKLEQQIEGRFLLKEMLGDEVLYYFDISSELNPRKTMILKEGMSIDFRRDAHVEFYVDPQRIYLFDIDSQTSILDRQSC